jgi:quinoprotein glucose dehydrogenase
MNRWCGLVCTCVLGACGGGGGGNGPAPPPPPANAAPVAHAGVSQVALRGAEVTLFGGLSRDADGDPLTYTWSFDTRPPGSAATIVSAGRTARFTADVLGTFTVALSVDDGRASSAPRSVRIDVVESRDLLTEGTAAGQWPLYAGNHSSDKYSPLDRIDRSNVNALQVAWRWSSPDNGVTGPLNSVFESTPLLIDGVLYTSTSFSQVAAIDAATGTTLWVFDPESYRYGIPPNNGFLHRGVAYAETGGRKYLYMATGDARLIALDPVSGEPDPDFGGPVPGTVSLLEDVPRLNASSVRLEQAHDQPDVPNLAGVRNQLGNTSPPAVCGDVLVVGLGVHDGEVLPPSPPGDVRGYDLVTGALRWTFHTVPREGEFGVDTWANESWRENGNTNVWAPMSVDPTLGYVYLPVSCPTNNYYGGRRPGDNLFANSVVALRCSDGARVWHYQTVHHDIWDYDLPAAPNLVDIVVDGVPVRALAQVSKQGFVYVLNRETGQPVWPIPEVPVPASTVPGEVTSPTQPMPTRPPPFVRQGVVRDALIDPSSVDDYDVGALYTPPTTRGLIVTPGEGGGANWGGAAFDPVARRLYVSGFGPLTYLIRMVYGGQPNFYYTQPQLFFGPTTGSPYPGLGSAITAYDLDRGEILWQRAGGSDGTIIGNASVLATATLLFYKNSALTSLNVVDKATGDLLREIPVGGRVTGSPMTYLLSGRQYVVVAIGRQDEPMELVALTVP